MTYSPSNAASAATVSSLMWKANCVALMSNTRCLAILYWLITRPTRTPILSGSLSLPVVTIRCTVSNAAVVAASSSQRLAARNFASCGLRHAIRRSPGKSS
jgi:hypothetical protein